MVTVMSPAKLSDTDKQELVDLYRQTPATTSTLAERFGVSISTVSRLLKNAIASTEYENLVLEKRGSRFAKGDSQLVLPLTKVEKPKPLKQKDQEKENIDVPAIANLNDTDGGKNDPAEDEKTVSHIKRRRTRSRKTIDSPPPEPVVPAVEIDTPAIVDQVDQFVESPNDPIENREEWETEVEPVRAITPRPQIVSIKPSALDEIVKDIDEDLDLLDEEDDEELDDLEDDEDDEDDDEDDYSEELAVATDKNSANGFIDILPFAQVTMPKHCYLVVDNKADLIVRPLNEFSLGGTIPPTELKEKTLPIFDNHRIARRFSLRTQKVIKVPNGEIVQKTAPALKAKGITRVFINGNVYAL